MPMNVYQQVQSDELRQQTLQCVECSVNPKVDFAVHHHDNYNDYSTLFQ